MHTQLCIYTGTSCAAPHSITPCAIPNLGSGRAQETLDCELVGSPTHGHGWRQETLSNLLPCRLPDITHLLYICICWATNIGDGPPLCGAPGC